MSTTVLAAGYTDFVSDAFLAAAFPDCRILLAGNTSVKTSFKNRISVHRGEMDAEFCKKAFRTYDFDQVVYFSRSVAPFSVISGQELESLRTILDQCGPTTRVIYVMGNLHPENDSLSVLENSAMELCRMSALRTDGVNVVVAPWVYALDVPQPVLSRLFSSGSHRLNAALHQEISFLAAEDLSLLIYRMFEDWSYSVEALSVPNVFTMTAEYFTALIQRECPEDTPEFVFSDQLAHPLSTENDGVLRVRFMWFPVYSVEEDMPELARFFHRSGRRSFEKLRSTTSVGRVLLRIAELLVGFVLTEIVLRLYGVSVQFKLIDFRLLYIVIMGTMYNIPMGLSAAALEMLSLAWGYAREGTGFLNLFYEPTNWLPFIAYFTVGAVCGYIHSRDVNLLKISQGETASITERYEYLQQINEDIMQEKQEYKQQIIGSRDSFGKIFDIAQQLNESHPRELLTRSLHVIEAVMANAGVAIYHTTGESPYGRLAVSSNGLSTPNSLPLAPYYERLHSVDSGNVWVNQTLDPAYPYYIFGIERDGKTEIIIMLWKADYSQLSLYYENLFRVVCGLISNSLVRAMDYQNARHRQMCVPETENVLLEEYFTEELGIALRSMEQKQSMHLLLHIKRDGLSLEELERKLSRCVRKSDIAGVWDDGLYLILYQAKESDLPILRTRFDREGLEFTLVPVSEQLAMLPKKAG